MHKSIHLYEVLDLSKMGPIGCPETYVRNYHSMMCKIPKQQISFTQQQKPEIMNAIGRFILLYDEIKKEAYCNTYSA